MTEEKSHRATKKYNTFKSNSLDSSMKYQKRFYYGSWGFLEQKLSFSVILCLLAWLITVTDQQYLNPQTTMTTKTMTMAMNDAKKNFFVQRPFSSPPTVRPPPYFNSLKSCSGVVNERENWEGNLCGDLNSNDGIPINPLGHKDFPDNLNYPFDAIKNKTLEFFRKALPVLKTYKSLPKVARWGQSDTHSPYRAKRSVMLDDGLVDLQQQVGEQVDAAEVEGRSLIRQRQRPLSLFGSRVKKSAHTAKPHNHNNNGNNNNNNNVCENAIFCKLLNTVYDKLPQGFQRLMSQETHKRLSHQLLQQLKSSVSSVASTNQNNNSNNNNNNQNQNHHHHHRHNNNDNNQGLMSSGYSKGELLTSETNNHALVDVPQTPCPSSAEYITPVFARNHEGAWRYVVQIPREGYFTQTVEVTKCVQTNCMFMDGTCKTSPRWQSLLVAEMYYPDAAFPLMESNNNFRDLHRQKRGVHYRRRQNPTQTPTQAFSPNTTETKTQNEREDQVETRESSFKEPEEHFALNSDDWSVRRKQQRGRRRNVGIKEKRNFGDLKSSKESFYDKDLDFSASTDTNTTTTLASHHCDGYDEIGCYQFRLFYDWFLIPGECKCWRKSFASLYKN